MSMTKKGMMDIAVDFYKNLFAKEDRGNIRLGENFWEEDQRVSTEENYSLVAPFSEEKIKDAVFSCYHEGAPS